MKNLLSAGLVTAGMLCALTGCGEKKKDEVDRRAAQPAPVQSIDARVMDKTIAGEYIADFSSGGEPVPPNWAMFGSNGVFKLFGTGGSFVQDQAGGIVINLTDESSLTGRVTVTSNGMTITGKAGGRELVHHYYRLSASQPAKEQLLGSWKPVSVLWLDEGKVRAGQPGPAIEVQSTMVLGDGKPYSLALQSDLPGDVKEIFIPYLAQDTLLLIKKASDGTVTAQRGYRRIKAASNE